MFIRVDSESEFVNLTITVLSSLKGLKELLSHKQKYAYTIEINPRYLKIWECISAFSPHFGTAILFNCQRQIIRSTEKHLPFISTVE